MTISVRSPDRKRSPGRARGASSKSAKRVARPKQKTLAQINRWMEENAEAVMRAARQNTLRLTGKEIL